MTAYEVVPSRESKCSDDRFTLSGTYTPPITTGLPKTIESICPECLRVIPAVEYIEDGKVMIKKGVPKPLGFQGYCLFRRKTFFADGRVAFWRWPRFFKPAHYRHALYG
jgi:hypothetical protein